MPTLEAMSVKENYRLVLATLAFVAAPSAVHAATTMTVWTQSVAYKVQPTTPPRATTSIVLEGARGSSEAHQIIVTAKGGALSGVNMTATNLTNLSAGAVHTIAASNVTFFRESFIDFTGVNADGGTWPVPEFSSTHDGRLSDPLIPFTDPYSSVTRWVGAPFSVGAGLNQPVWMDVYIPESAGAGTYQGNVIVTATGQPPVTVPITLTVWSLVLPDMRAVTTYFQMNLDGVIEFHRGTWACSGNSCWFEWTPQSRLVVKRYEQLAHAHRIDTAEKFIPDPSNGCSPPSDWGGYDAAMQPYMDGGYWSDHIPSGRLDTPFTPGSSWGVETCTRAQYTALAKAWATHLKGKGWFNRAIVYALDEPDPSSYPAIARNSKWMQDGDPDWKSHIMDTTAPRTSNVETLNPALGIYDVCLKCYDTWYYQGEDVYGRAQWPGLFAKGIKLWFYESNAQAAPYTTYATNTLLGLEPRMMKWGAWYEGASGFLYWDISTWDIDNPWGPNILYGKTGDGVLVYPGNHDGLRKPKGSPPGVAIDGPIPSYRLKLARAGLQDWALFSLAQQKGLTTYARSQLARAYSQLGACEWSGCAPINGQWYWRTSDALMMQIRHNIAQAIMAASSTSGEDEHTLEP